MDPKVLPAGPPTPEDDGPAAHLVGDVLPSVPLSAADGTRVDVAALPGRTMPFAYPRTGVPGEPELDEDPDQVAGQMLVRRLPLVVDDGVVTHVWYPVFPPHTHAEDVLA